VTDRKPPKGLGKRTLAALAASTARDSNTAARHVRHIVRRWGAPGLFAACAGWAEAFRQHTAGTKPPGAVFGFQVTVDGQPVDPGSVDADEADMVWALRFISAVANRDADTAQALFNLDDRDAVLDGALRVLALAGRETNRAGGIR
jgi:hypothetical protein